MVRGIVGSTRLALVLGSFLLFGCGGGGGSSSGGGSGGTATGVFVDSPVSGLGYVTSGGLVGTTNEAGQFSYSPGETVTFAVGGLILGSFPGQEFVMPSDLAQGSANAEAAELNIARLLLSIDDDGDPENGIAITEAVAREVSRQIEAGREIDFALSTEEFGTSPDALALIKAVDGETSASTFSMVSVAQARGHLDRSEAKFLEGRASFTIDSSGGDGSSEVGFYGGDAGFIGISKEYGPGKIEVLKEGRVDASFTPTANLEYQLGGNALTISSDTVIAYYDPAAGTPPAEGVPYLLKYPYDTGSGEIRDLNLYISDGDADFADEAAVTGIEVASGATMTLELNYSGRYGHEAWFALESDLVNRGTITTTDAEDPAYRGGLGIEADNVINLGTIATKGILPGQNGGGIYLDLTGDFINQGPVLSYGADNAEGDGGDGGYFEYYSWEHLGVIGGVQTYDGGRMENTALIDAHGGVATGASGYGGWGGSIGFYPIYGLNNSGRIDASGGDGVDGGGSGSDIYLTAEYMGDVRNSGTLDASGGDATEGDGGEGLWVYIYASGGSVINSGDIDCSGGSTTAEGAVGGISWDVFIETWDSDFNGVDYPAGDILVSGNVDLSGGDAPNGYGGSGGFFWLGLYNREGEEQVVSLLGYSLVDASGGTGHAGGDGSDIEIYAFFGEGPVVNEAVLDAGGGNGVLTGGAGNWVTLNGASVANSALVSAAGGDSDPTVAGSVGGAGGRIDIDSEEGQSLNGFAPDIGGGAGETAGLDGDFYLDDVKQ